MRIGNAFMNSLNHHIRHDGLLHRVESAEISEEVIDDVDYKASDE
jgi:hypothetical protein